MFIIGWNETVAWCVYFICNLCGLSADQIMLLWL